MTSQEVISEMNREAEDHENAIAKYKNLTGFQLNQLYMKGEIYRSHTEKLDRGMYCGTYYYFYASRCETAGVNDDLIKIVYCPSGFTF